MLFETHRFANVFERAWLAIGGGLRLSQQRPRRKFELFGR